MQVKISDIIIPDRKRKINKEYVSQLAESIHEIGLLNPITLSSDYKLLSGLHRLEAIKSLGMEHIECHVMVSGGVLYEELIEIDENLIRANLTVLEQGEQLERRKAIYEELHPETKPTRNGAFKGNQFKEVSELNSPTFANDTASKIGVSNRTVEQRVQIARDIDDSVKDMIRSTNLADSQAELLELAKEKNPETQKKIAEKVISGEAKNIKQAIQQEKRQQIQNEITEPKIPDGLFDIIYADPPWRYEFAESNNREIENQYPTMELGDIKALKVPSAETCVLLLWATSPKLEEAIQVLNSWGFTYRTCAVWDKQIIGCGYWWRQQHEILLLGVKGNPKCPDVENRFSSVFNERRGQHSKKPEFYYTMIESMFPNKRYIELFARNDRIGWSSYGNQK